MFKYAYKLTPHATKADVVYLSPTSSTYTKAFAPMVIVWIVMGVLYTAADQVEKREQRKNLTKPPKA